MEFQKQNNFEEEWRQAFESASISPPDDLWDKIERELDRKERRPFIFFLRPSGIAAGIAAALVLVLGGILFFREGAPKNMAKQQKGDTQNIAKRSPNGQNKTPIDNNQTQIQPNTDVLASTQSSAQKLHTQTKTGIQNKKEILSNDHTIALTTSERKEEPIVPVVTNVSPLVESQVTEPLTAEAFADNLRNSFSELNSLESKHYRYFGSSRTLNRNKLAFEAEVAETKELASNESKLWLGVQSGVSPFDPNVKLGNLNTLAMVEADAFAKNSNSNLNSTGSALLPGDNRVPTITTSQPKNAIKAGMATNMGFVVGYKLSKKFHVESGLRYLRGNSTLQTNTYAYQQSGYVNTFFADYLLQNSFKNNAIVGSSPVNTVVADASQFGNRYEYLMIPMQVGYSINLSSKLGVNLLAGISTDIFLQNSISTDNSLVLAKSTFGSSSKTYRPLNVSGLGGVRASYLVGKHWQASIGTSYQHALFSGLNSSTDLQMRLKMFGINYGVNYRF